MGKLALCIKREELDAALDDWKPVLIDRDICESDPNTLQLIPYVSLVDMETRSVFMYQRGSASGEDKLKAKWSIGLGGHVDRTPEPEENIVGLLACEACRELKEEVGIDIDPEESNIYDAVYVSPEKSLLYIPYSDNTADHVHLGIHFVEEVTKDQLGDSEKDIITNGEWVPISKLVEYASGVDTSRNLEYWSMLATTNVVEYLISESFLEKRDIGYESASPEMKALLDERVGYCQEVKI
jgi:predicted NUDIX family phosphoesterase